MRRVLWLIAGLAVVGAGLWSLRPADAGTATATGAPAETPAGPAASGPPGAARAMPHAGPLSAEGLRTREALQALARQRLQRAEQTLASYQAATRYPHESRPMREHPDQVRPFEFITEDRPLVTPGTQPVSGVHVHTRQERVFVTGAETVRLSVSASDDNGRPLPLSVTRSIAFDLPDPRQAAGRPQVAVPFSDDGSGTLSAVLAPAAQGFADYAGTLRVQVDLNQAGQRGQVHFDVVYSPQVPAEWLGGAREQVVEGSLDFLLPLRVLQAGRYVVSGRVDDANGKPFALLSFNEELGSGPQQVRLRLFGKLLRDGAPAFPLTLRDVEGFLLHADTFPDRAMMARLAGAVLQTRTHALGRFSEAEWQSEERSRYLAEYGRDVDAARQQLERASGKP